MFHIGSDKILAKNCHVKGRVTLMHKSCLYVVKKPVRLVSNDSNTLYSHWIRFTYTVDNVRYTGKLFIPCQYRSPQNGEIIDVYYDPEKPENYACYAFGPIVRPIGW